MIKGLYAAASAMLAGLVRQETLAHNVANLDTPGYKRLEVTLDDFRKTLVFPSQAESNQMGKTGLVGLLGLGVETAPVAPDFSQGALQHTGQPLDLAIEGAGFFQVKTPEGERYTRDGRFIRDASGQLVTVDGYQILNSSGQPITLPEGELMVLGDGNLMVNGQPAGQLGLAAFKDPAAELTRSLPNTFAAAGQPTGEERGFITQGYLETANLDSAEIMTQMVIVARAYEAAQQMVQNQDELIGKTIATLGRF
jgi:flagellar basal body rod protein FlgG